jgi:hypothetical protein
MVWTHHYHFGRSGRCWSIARLLFCCYPLFTLSLFLCGTCFIVCKPVFTMNLVEIVLTWRYTMINQFNLKIETLLSIFGLYLLITASRIECYWTILYLKHTFIWFYYSQSFKLFGFSNLSILSVPDEGYSRAHVLFTLFEYSGDQHISRCVFVLFFLRLVYPMLPVSLNCPFVIALRYSLTFVLLIVFSLLKLQLLNKQNKIYVFSIMWPVNKIR